MHAKVVVGAPQHQVLGKSSAGAVYVFSCSTGAQEAKITVSDARQLLSLALRSGRQHAARWGAAVLWVRPLAGSAYVFDFGRDAERRIIVAPISNAGAWFGYAVSVFGASAVSGLPMRMGAVVQRHHELFSERRQRCTPNAGHRP